MQNPTWFPISEIPYDEMLPADKDIIKRVFEEDTFIGKVRFNKDMSQVIESYFDNKPLHIK